MSRSSEKEKIVKYKDKNYRSVDALSYSAISTYSKSPYEYYRKYILKIESEDTDSLRLGQLLDVKATDPDNFDKYFVIASAKTPTPQMLQFCKFLLANSGIEKFEDNLKKSYEELLEWNGGKLQKTYDKYIISFYEEGKDYYQELLASRDKTVVSIDEATLSEELFKKWQNAKQFHCPGCITLTKVPIYFTMMEMDWKAEIDKIIIDGETKTVKVRDLKITSFMDDFFVQGFLKRGYYLQMGVYLYAVKSWMQQNGYADYKIDGFAFECVDAKNQMLPLLYVCPDSYELLAWEGFYWGNKYYKGILQLTEELQESRKLNTWNISIRNLKNNGVVIMPEIKND